MTRFRRNGHYRTSKYGVEHYVRSHDVERDDWYRGGSTASLSGWSLRTSRDPVTYPTTCWWCGVDVFFLRDENGGCALFDELGAPWPVHACWREHQDRQEQALTAIDEAMHREGYTGAFDPDDFEEYVLPSRPRVLWPFWGILLGVDCGHDWPAQYQAHSADWCALTVLFGSTVYNLLTPTRLSVKPVVGMPVKVHARCACVIGEPVLLATEIEQHDASGRVLSRRKVAELAESTLACHFCGRSIRSFDAWGVTEREQVECGGCRRMRGNLSPVRFAAAARRIAQHMSTREE